MTTVIGAITRKRKPAAASAGPAKRVTTKKNVSGSAKASRVARREPDIPLDQIAGTYTPTQTSLKSGFRASGADRQRDQEFASGAGNERWNDEDRFTNKSGDPRIGTHGRTYEPGESRKATAPDEE